jgi:hypothetical protein
MEPANRRPAPGTGSAPLSTFSSVTGGQAAMDSRQVGPSEGGATYADVLAGAVAPLPSNGPLKPTTVDSDPSGSAVSTETATGACLAICTGLRMASWMAPLQRPSWPKSAYYRPFLFQVILKSVLSWHGCERFALAVRQPKPRARI